MNDRVRCLQKWNGAEGKKMECFQRGEFSGSLVGKEWNIGEFWRMIGQKFYVTYVLF